MKHTLLLGASPVPLVSRPSSLCVTHLIGVAFKSCTEMPFLTVGRVGRKQVKRGKEGRSWKATMWWKFISERLEQKLNASLKTRGFAFFVGSFVTFLSVGFAFDFFCWFSFFFLLFCWFSKVVLPPFRIGLQRWQCVMDYRDDNVSWRWQCVMDYRDDNLSWRWQCVMDYRGDSVSLVVICVRAF